MSFARWQPYYTDREVKLDRRIHAFGLLLALIATPLLLGLTAESRRPGLVLPCAIYLLSLLGSSEARRCFATRRSDGPTIVGSCGASTTLRSFCSSPALTHRSRQVHGERVGPTVAVWAGAPIGAAYKLAFPGRLAGAVAGRLRGARLVRAAADTSVHGAAGSGADSRWRCALYGRRGASSPTDAVSHANLAWFCDCRRRLPLGRGP